jgi:hypothetical protein
MTMTDNVQRSRVKPIALYFPQFHAIPENDEWWGKGFTDWNNVRSGKPQFEGHYQPRVPANNNYYDQSLLETLRWQQDLAKRHGIFGFCHYHYWFSGKQLLETPTNRMLEDKSLDLPFCLAWANETWSRRWDGLDHHILIQQKHDPDPAQWTAHFDYLFKCWSDDRAIKVDGKPVFLIYRPHRIDEIGRMFDHWRALARERGLPGLFLVAIKQYEYPDPSVLDHFDASMHFQPFEALYSPDYANPNPAAARKERWFGPLRRLPEPVLDWMRTFKAKFATKLEFYDYESVWKQILKVERDRPNLPCFPGAFMDWDNAARYKERARLFRGASPERFKHYFRELVQITSTRPEPENHLFINAWNEWSEGTYLEPDERYGLAYIEAIRDALIEVNGSI